MKINKILAAGAAASIAVSSLAAVASAEKRSFPLTYSYATITANPVIKGAGAEQLDGNKYGTAAITVDGYITKGGITEAYDIFPTAAREAGNVVPQDGVYRAETDGYDGVTASDFDAFIPVVATTNNAYFLDLAGGLKVTATGSRRDQENYILITRETKLVKIDNYDLVSNGAETNKAINADNEVVLVDADANVYTDDNVSTLFALPLYYGTAPINGLMPFEFDAVQTITVDASGAKTFEDTTVIEEYYNKEVARINTKWDYDYVETALAAATINTKADAIIDWERKYAYPNVYVNFAPIDAIKNDEGDVIAADNPLITYQTAWAINQNMVKPVGAIHGKYVGEWLRPYDAANAAVAYDNATGQLAAEMNPDVAFEMGNAFIEKIADLLYVGINWRVESAVMAESNAWLPLTDVRAPFGTLTRDEIWNLGTTDAYTSFDRPTYNIDGATQTYTVEDYRKGTMPMGFAGLASQMADFFNLSLNGTVTFTFVDADAAGGSTWLTGGVPSTEVGLRNVLSGANPDDFALYVNYNTTTGSLETVVDIDIDAGEVTFDISKTLTALGGYTIGTIHDIYYGMTKYTTTRADGAKGMWVSKVTLEKDEASDVGGDTDDDDVAVVVVEDDDDDVAVVVEDDDDVIIEDDDDVIIEDDDDIIIEDDDIAIDDDDIGGEVIIVTPEDDDDANPHTGVALAVVPAIVAAAAIVVSKKRK